MENLEVQQLGMAASMILPLCLPYVSLDSHIYAKLYLSENIYLIGLASIRSTCNINNLQTEPWAAIR